MKRGRPKKSAIVSGYELSNPIQVEGQKGRYEVSFRRWIVREIDSGRMTVGEFGQQFGIELKDRQRLLQSWRRQYRSEIVFTLPVMDDQEKSRLEALEKQNRELIKQLEEAQMRNIVLETLIDVAEEDLKINIRKKRGPKP